MPSLSIVMPCHNRAHDLIKTLRAYDRQNVDEPFELIAVDDASSDASYEVLASYQPERYDLRVARLESNRGPAAARNHGLEMVRAPLVLFVGDDIIPDQNLVRGHLAAHQHERQTEVAILGQVAWPEDLPVNTLMSHIDGVGAQQFSYHFMQDGQTYDFRHFYTANISVKRDFLWSLDRWFDTDFRYAAYEDAELAFRLSKRGLRIRYVSPLVGYHYHYHTIWTFANRQRNTGRMASVLTAKHPELRFTFRAQYVRLLNSIRALKAFLVPLSDDAIDRLETFTCKVASFYEWSPNDLIDRLYLTVLDYFYYDGVIRGIFGTTGLTTRLRSAHARRYLIPGLRGFTREADQLNISVPAIAAPTPFHVLFDRSV